MASNDSILRLWSSDSKVCIFLIKISHSFNYEFGGGWFMSTIYEDDKKRNYFNVFSLDKEDILKQPIACLSATNNGKIISFEISRSKIYVITLNDVGEISTYYLWNMNQVFCINVKNDGGFKIIKSDLQLIEKEIESKGKVYGVVLIDKKGTVKIIDPLSGRDINIKQCNNIQSNGFSNNLDQFIVCKASLSGKNLLMVFNNIIKVFQ